MTTVYFIRHGEAEGNLLRIAQGHYDGKITEKGYRQLAALSKRFENIHLDAAYSSDLSRAVTTAEAVCKPKGLEIHIEPDFREIHMGYWEGRPWQWIYDNDAEQIDAFNKHLEKFHPNGGETPQQVIDRFYPKLMQYAHENDGKTIAIFSHGCALRYMVAILKGLTIADIGRTMHGDNTAVSLVEIDGDKARVIYQDDSSHLDAENLSTLATQDWWKD